jgi:hypothetical protein
MHCSRDFFLEVMRGLVRNNKSAGKVVVIVFFWRKMLQFSMRF